MGRPRRRDRTGARPSEAAGPATAGVASAESPLGAQVADAVVAFLGSWRFIVLQTVLVALWIAGNVYLWFRFDPYPFILLNLAFSTQAAYAAPVILLASNRAAARDRLTLEHAAAEADLEEAQNERLLEATATILERVERLEDCILELEREILEAVGGERGHAVSRALERRPTVAADLPACADRGEPRREPTAAPSRRPTRREKERR